MLENTEVASSDVRVATIPDCPGSSITDPANERLAGYGQLHNELLVELKRKFSARK